MQGRGKKTKYDKNARANEEFQKGKKFERYKQMWVWDEELLNMKAVDIVDGKRKGHWEKVK